MAIGTPQDGAVILAEKMRNSIATKRYDKVGHITASFGVAERFYSESKDMCFRRADIMLYKAKNSGRNCVVSWNSSDQVPIALLKIEWIEKWNSGNDIIDADHRMLIELSNKLIESTLNETPMDRIEEQIHKIVSHIVYHFEREEQVLQLLEYSEFDEHLQSHKELIQETEEIVEEYINGNANITDLISFLVGHVVVGHLLMMDTKFFPYTLKDKR